MKPGDETGALDERARELHAEIRAAEARIRKLQGLPTSGSPREPGETKRPLRSHRTLPALETEAAYEHIAAGLFDELGVGGVVRSTADTFEWRSVEANQRTTYLCRVEDARGDAPTLVLESGSPMRRALLVSAVTIAAVVAVAGVIVALTASLAIAAMIGVLGLAIAAGFVAVARSTKATEDLERVTDRLVEELPLRTTRTRVAPTDEEEEEDEPSAASAKRGTRGRVP